MISWASRKKQLFRGRSRITILPGQYYDAETGLHYNWHRCYDPETGRYISADPIGLAGGMNLYVYVGGNSVNNIDPEGLAIKLKEKINCANNPDECKKIWDSKKEAEEATLKEFGHLGHNDRSDAFRHCVWNCSMAQKMPSQRAKMFADAHEDFYNNPLCEKNMDLYNNQIGRDLGTLNPKGNCSKLCLNAPLQEKPDGDCKPCKYEN